MYLLNNFCLLLKREVSSNMAKNPTNIRGKSI